MERRTWQRGAIGVLAVLVALASWRLTSSTPSDGADGNPTNGAGTGSSQPSKPGAEGKPTALVAGSAVAPIDSIGAGAPAKVNESIVYQAKWGTAVSELGHSRPKEANPEGPMSFTVDANGNTVVLDQVNGRLVRIGKDGKVIDTIASPVKAAQDVVAAKDGSLLVLDRLADKTVSVIGPDGKVHGALPIEGKGIGEGGAVTGVFVDGKDVYVEREHTQLVRIGDTSGNPDAERKEIPGRPTRDGLSYVNAWINPPPGDSVFVTSTQREPEEHRFTRQIQLPFVVTGLALLDTDRSGVIYVAATGLLASLTSPDGEPTLELVCLEPTHGAPIGEVALPVNASPDETFRELVVLDGGGALYMVRGDGGVTVSKVDCRPSF